MMEKTAKEKDSEDQCEETNEWVACYLVANAPAVEMAIAELRGGALRRHIFFFQENEKE